jgi:hypothetical protein
MAVIDSAMEKASVFVKASKKWLTMRTALGYDTTEFTTAVLSFIVQALEMLDWFEKDL